MDELDVKQPYVAQKTHHLSGAPEAAVLRFQILMNLFDREGLSGVLLQIFAERPGGQGLRKNSCI